MRHLPKIELHCHLDGSLRAKTIYELAILNNVDLPTRDINHLSDYLTAPLDCDSLNTYLQKFDLPISVMQTVDALSRCAYELVEDCALETIKYLEIRFNPFAHMAKGLSLKTVIETVIEGIKRGMLAYDIKVSLILSFNKSDDLLKLYDLVEVGKDYIGHGVVAIDLCGAEEEGFVKKFVKPIEAARKAGFRITIHAGETIYPKNVMDAIDDLGAERIGHGVAIISDAKIYNYIIESDILLEVCPTSNIQTKAFHTYKEHPVNDFLEKGINLSIGTDNRTVSNVSLTDEYKVLVTTFGWNKNTFGHIFNRSIQGAFANESTKEWLREISLDYYGSIK